MVKSSKHPGIVISFLLFFGCTTTAIAESTPTSTLKSASITPLPIVTTALLAQSPNGVAQPTESSEAENIALEIAKLFLECLKVIVWPIVTIYLVHLFKSEVKELLQQRLINAEILGNKFVFQAASQEAPPANPQAKVELSQVTPAGFFTAEGIRQYSVKIQSIGFT